MDSTALGHSSELIVCGWDEVFILDLSHQENRRPKKVWSWRANDRADLPQHMKGSRFATTDDCKPVDGGRKILITSSGWGVALVDRNTSRTLFYAVAENAHSADMLPGDRLVVAASVHEGEGPPRSANSLLIFDAKVPEKELYRTELPRAHGVVWDDARQVLWALGGGEIRGHGLADWASDKPSLALIFRLDLPERGGHDLYPVPGTPLLTVTTFRHCWTFDRDSHGFSLHQTLSEKANVKSISVHPVTGQLAYVQGEGENWWAERIHFLNSEGTLHLPGEHLYKVRWNVQPR